VAEIAEDGFITKAENLLSLKSNMALAGGWRKVKETIHFYLKCPYKIQDPNSGKLRDELQLLNRLSECVLDPKWEQVKQMEKLPIGSIVVKVNLSLNRTGYNFKKSLVCLQLKNHIIFMLPTAFSYPQ
jgi:hypothetical protein